jgi:guanosine-3',5'-bis(diphosphate) 3'-pyrophosphohydrolase
MIIKKAKEFATEKHQGQKRKFSGRPYIIHPQAVATLLEEYGYSNEVIAAAWLHDVIEDCEVTVKELIDKFGKYVTDLIVEITHPNVKGDRVIRWYDYLHHYTNASPKGQSLKIADRFCNIKDYCDDWEIMENKDKKFIKEVYFKETLELLVGLRHADDMLKQRLINQLNTLVGLF